MSKVFAAGVITEQSFASHMFNDAGFEAKAVYKRINN